MVESALEGSLLRAHLLNEVSNAPQLGVHAGGDHQPLSAPASDHRAEVGHVAVVAEGKIVACERVRHLADGFGFARQRGLLDL